MDQGQHILIPIISVWFSSVIGIIGLGRPCGLNEFLFSSLLLPLSALISLMFGFGKCNTAGKLEIASKRVSSFYRLLWIR